ncbi:hypothetical protein SHINKOU_278 [Klebsiella phage vB_KaeM_Shinkou]|nr:hypothetical protein SHINKOU_278 [Klebsiella phage vB_KaeM_Shinkou]
MFTFLFFGDTIILLAKLENKMKKLLTILKNTFVVFCLIVTFIGVFAWDLVNVWINAFI